MQSIAINLHRQFRAGLTPAVVIKMLSLALLLVLAVHYLHVSHWVLLSLVGGLALALAYRIGNINASTPTSNQLQDQQSQVNQLAGIVCADGGTFRHQPKSTTQPAVSSACGDGGSFERATRSRK